MGPSPDGIEPTVLLVGAGERFTPAFQAALGRYRVQVESADLGTVVDAVIVTAPDLVLLMGDAAKDGGSFVLQKLSGLSQNFTVPVVVLNDDSELDQKLSAFRHGATAILPRSASVDATAAEVAKLAREIPDQGSDSQGGLGEATLDEFVGALSRQLRTGLVNSLSEDGADSQDLRLTLGRGRPLTEFLDAFVRRVRRHVVRAEPLRYELGAGSAASEGLPRASLPPGKPEIQGLRIVLADDDTPRADAVAQELRGRGVTVVVTDLDPSPTRFQTLRQADPTVFVIGEEHAHGAGYELLRRVRRDSRLRWASLLVVRWHEIWSEERGSTSIQRLESTLAGLAEPERALLARAQARTPFDTRLEATGPARCLRTLEKLALAQRVHVENARVELSIDLSEGLVVGVEGRTLDAEAKPLSGVNALSALMVLGSGRLRIEPVDQPATANVMTPVEAALHMADAETPPIAPSIPAAGTASMHPPFQPDMAPRAAPGLPSGLLGAAASVPSIVTSASRPGVNAPVVNVPVVNAPVVNAPVVNAPPGIGSAPHASLQPAPIVPVGTPSVASVPRPGTAGAPPPPPGRAAPRAAGPPPLASLTAANLPSMSVTAPMAFTALPPPTASVVAPAPSASSPTAVAAATLVAATTTLGAAVPTPPGTAATSEFGTSHERTPPAVTVPAVLAADASSQARAAVRSASRFGAHVRALSVWLAAQDAKLHARRISGRVAAVLVGLGALQGLLLVLLFAGVRWLVRPSSATETALAASAPASVAAPEQPSSPPSLPAKPAAPSAEVAAVPRVEPVAADGSGRDVPDCRTLLSSDPPHDGFYPVAAAQAMRAGRRAIVRGDLEAAQASLCRAAHYNTKHPEIALDLALVLLLRRDGPQALTWARRAVELDPNGSGAKDALGDALARTGNETEARAAWLDAAGIDGSNETMVRALVTRAAKQADHSLRHRDLVTAERSFRRAAILEPRSQSSQSGLAYVLLELGDAQAAVAWARRAVAGAPRSSNARLVLGDALAKSDDKLSAAREWREAALLDPTNRAAQKRLRSAGLSAP